MKSTAIAFAAALFLAANAAHPQSGGMKGMEGMDKKGMSMEPKDMKGMDMKDTSKAQKGPHKAVGVVKKLDKKAGTVTLDHEPVKSLNWPAMSMTFQVKNKALLDKFAPGRKVEVEFEQHGKQNVIGSVK